MKLRAAIGQLADEIEAEMRRLGLWLGPERLPTEDEVLSGGAFGIKSVPFESWLQVVLIARLRAVAAGDHEPPKSSSVGTQAMREWDGVFEREHLGSLLSRLDDVINRHAPSL